MDLKQKKIFGHQKQEKILSQIISCQKVFPVWIFWGANGIGKSSIARKFAKCLLVNSCSNPSNLDLNENHPIHKEIDNLIHPDFFILDMPSVSVEDIRNLTKKIRKKPVKSQRRVIIIDRAEKLNKNICNALLKILEEPPTDTVFILICSNLGTIPTTLLSRAYKLHFLPLNQNEMEAVLNLYDIKDSKTLAKISGGSVGDALFLNDNNGVQLYNDILNCLAQDYENSNKLVSKIMENRLAENFSIVKQLIIQCLQTYIESISGLIPNPIFQQIAVKSVKREVEKVFKIISLLNHGESLALDPNGMIAEAFELFFERSSYEF